MKSAAAARSKALVRTKDLGWSAITVDDGTTRDNGFNSKRPLELLLSKAPKTFEDITVCSFFFKSLFNSMQFMSQSKGTIGCVEDRTIFV